MSAWLRGTLQAEPAGNDHVCITPVPALAQPPRLKQSPKVRTASSSVAAKLSKLRAPHIPGRDGKGISGTPCKLRLSLSRQNQRDNPQAETCLRSIPAEASV
jgi:hypothetical protein